MLSLTFLGTGAATPTIDRNVSGLALQREGETILFDCGEGNQRQMMRYGVGFSFTEIFFTHYHADHILGVTGLLRTMGLQDRTAGVVLYGPRGAQRVLGTAISLGIERNKFPVEIVELQPGQRLVRGEYDIVVFETEHRADTVGYALVEHTRLGRFHPERARELGVPEGPMWGRLHKGETVVLDDGRTVSPADLVGEPRAGRTVVYSGDTRPCLSLTEAARGADLLVHEATFGSEELGAGPGDGALHGGRGRAGGARRRECAGWFSPTSVLATRVTRRSCSRRHRRSFRRRSSRGTGLTVDVPFAD